MIFYVLLCCLLTVILVIFITKKKYYNQENMLAYNTIDEDEFSIYHYDKDCILRCGDKNSCKRLKYRDENYLKCKKCESESKYLYHDIVNYNCLHERDKYKNEVKCNFDIGLGCPNYNNISSQEMIRPYYIMKKNTKDNNSITNSCEFCWNLN